GSAILNVQGDLQIQSNNNAKASIDLADGASILNLDGNFDITGQFSWTTGKESTINFIGTEPQTLPVINGLHFNNINVENTSSEGVTLAGKITPSYTTGNLNIKEGIFNNGGYEIAGNAGKVLKVQDDAILNLTGDIAMPSSFNYELSANSTVQLSGTTDLVAASYGNLTIASATGKTSQISTISLTGDVTIAGDLNIEADNIMEVNNYNISITGDILMHGELNNVGAILFEGSDDQTILMSTGTNQIRDIAISKNEGSLTLASPVNITNSLNLAAGNIYTTSENILTLESGATILNASAESYVVGPIAITTNSVNEYIFPIGSQDDRYLPVFVKPANGSINTYLVEFVNDAYEDILSLQEGLDGVSDLEYVSILGTDGGNLDARITLSYDINSGIMDIANLALANYNGVLWVDTSTDIDIVGDVNSGTISADIVGTYGPVAVAYQSADGGGGDPNSINDPNDANKEFKVYPNPSSKDNVVNISFSGFNPNDEILVIVYDVLGSLTYSKVIEINGTGSNLFALDPSNKLSSGVYYITGTSNNKYYQQRLIIK
ncbi:MAG: T9SS type A sorting domain-containing protein, partial [Bacteroidia bacterium]|nr:T9SS type A sorting domain-containing protein [Bacteroidia bacterium]